MKWWQHWIICPMFSFSEAENYKLSSKPKSHLSTSLSESWTLPFPSSAMLPNWGAHRLPVSYSAPVPLRHLRETPPQQSKVFLSHDDRRLCIFSLTRLMRRNMGDTTPSPSALHPALRMPMLLIFRQPARNVIKCNLFMVKFITGIAFLDPQFNNEWAST